MPDLLDRTDALGVQPLLSLQRTKTHERITDNLLLLRRHQPSIQCLGRSLAAPIIFVPHRDKWCKTPTFADPNAASATSTPCAVLEETAFRSGAQRMAGIIERDVRIDASPECPSGRNRRSHHRHRIRPGQYWRMSCVTCAGHRKAVRPGRWRGRRPACTRYRAWEPGRLRLLVNRGRPVQRSKCCITES